MRTLKSVPADGKKVTCGRILVTFCLAGTGAAQFYLYETIKHFSVRVKGCPFLKPGPQLDRRLCNLS
jgi:hypothetical protein